MKKLASASMESIEGGVSRGEYCRTLRMIIANSTSGEAALYAWSANCAGYYSL